MYPTAMATASLNNNYQYVNMGLSQQQQQEHPISTGEAVTEDATARANNNRSGGRGKNNKNHKTKTRPQVRQRRSSPSLSLGWHYESAAMDMDGNNNHWQSPPQVEVEQLRASRRHSSRGSSRLGRVINKANLDSREAAGNAALNEDISNAPDEDSVVGAAANAAADEGDDIEAAADNDSDSEATIENEDDNEEDAGREDSGGHNEDFTTDSARLRGRSKGHRSSSLPTTKNPITTTRTSLPSSGGRHENEEHINVNNGSSDDEEAAAPEPTTSLEQNGLPKYSFLRGDNFNNRNPAMQYDSAIINNNNVNTNRDGVEVAVAAAASTSPSAMELECVAGYDGGLPQFFVLEAYDSRTRKLRLNITSAFPDLPLFRIDMDGTYYEKRLLRHYGNNWPTRSAMLAV